jgi:uncharacterized protein (DUF3084 family)
VSIPAVVTLIGVGLLVAALAATLLIAVFLLRKTLFTLGTINVGLRAIAHRVEPLQEVLGDINAELVEARDVLLEVLEGAAPDTREAEQGEEVAP